MDIHLSEAKIFYDQNGQTSFHIHRIVVSSDTALVR
jgi:hypothetical protein